MNGIRFRIPLSYMAEVNVEKQELLAHTLSGRLRSRFADQAQLKSAMIEIVAPERSQSAKTGVATMMDVFIRSGFQKRGERDVTLAGRSGRCVEFYGPALGNESFRFGEQTTWIVCDVQDELFCSFSGTPGAVKDFYRLLQTAEPIARK
jgi:hypothetical protein